MAEEAKGDVASETVAAPESMNIEDLMKDPAFMDLFSRQIATFGMQSMAKLVTMHVVIVGLKGLGVEVAKNVILAGPFAVTLVDKEPAAPKHQGANFYVKDSDLGTPLAAACRGELQSLNDRCKVFVADELSEKLVESARCIVFTEGTRAELVKWNKIARKHNCAFVSTNAWGFSGSVFTDFGDKHTMFDSDGLAPSQCRITHISNDEKGLVRVLSAAEGGTTVGKPHKIECNDHTGWVRFAEVEGMHAKDEAAYRKYGLNINETSEPFRCEYVDPHTIKVGDLSGLSEYRGGGLLIQVKRPVDKSYSPLSACLLNKPEQELTDFTKFYRDLHLHIAYQGVYSYMEAHEGAFPPANDDAAAAEVLKLAKAMVYGYIIWTTVLMFGYVLPPVDGGIISTLFWAIAMTGCGCQWYFACSCSFVDPGIVPRDWMIKDLPETEYSKKLLLPEGRACDHVCRTCNIVRPRLSHHCSMCDHCVVGFDHHCSWLGVCIGHRNRKHFLMLLATCTALCALSPIAGAYRLYLDYDPESATLLGHSSLSYFFYTFILALVTAYGIAMFRHGYAYLAAKYLGTSATVFMLFRAYQLNTDENPLHFSTFAGFWMVLVKSAMLVVFYLFNYVTWETAAKRSTTKEAMRRMAGKPIQREVEIEDGVATQWYDRPIALHPVKMNPFMGSFIDAIIKCLGLGPFPRAKVLRDFFARETVEAIVPWDATYAPRDIPKPRQKKSHEMDKASNDPCMLIPCCKDPQGDVVYNYSVPAGLPVKRMAGAGTHGTCQHSHGNGGGHGHSHGHGHGGDGGHGHSHGGDGGHGHSHGGDSGHGHSHGEAHAAGASGEVFDGGDAQDPFAADPMFNDHASPFATPQQQQAVRQIAAAQQQRQQMAGNFTASFEETEDDGSDSDGAPPLVPSGEVAAAHAM